MPEATLRAKITGDSAEFQRSTREAIASAKEFGDAVKDAMKETLLQVTGLVLGVESIKEALDKTFEGIKGVFELSKDLEHLSDRTGIAARDLVLLQTEFKLSGLQADQVGTTINRMQRSIENAADKGGEAATVFSRLGLNIYELQGLNPDQQFEMIRERLASIEDPARRAQAAMQLFGRQGAEMLFLFKNEGVGQEAANALGAQADILARNADTFQEIAGLMEVSGIKIQGFFVGLAEPIGRVILPVFKELESIDLTKWGESIGGGIADAVRVLYNAFENNEIGEVIGVSLKFAFAEGINYLVGGAVLFGQAMQDIFATLGSASFATGLVDILVGAADSFIGTMMSWLQPFSDAMVAIMNVASEDFARGLGVMFQHIPGLGGAGDWLVDHAHIEGTPLTAAAVKQARMDANQQAQIMALQGDPDSQEYRDKEAAIRAQGDVGGTIGGATSEQFMAVAKQLLETGGQYMSAPLQNLFTQISALKFTPGNVINSQQYGDQLADLLKKFSTAIPGEGKPNAPDQGRGSSGGSDGSFGEGKNIVGIHAGAGGWQGVNEWTNGPVSIDGSGMAGRAGRIVAGPHTVEENTTNMATTLTSINTKLEHFSGPS